MLVVWLNFREKVFFEMVMWVGVLVSVSGVGVVV